MSPGNVTRACHFMFLQMELTSWGDLWACFPQPASVLGLTTSIYHTGNSDVATFCWVTQATQCSWLFSVAGIKTVTWVKKTTDLRWSPPPLKKEERVQFYQTTFDFFVRSQEGVFVFLTFSDDAQDKQVKTERAQQREKKETENIH